LNEKGLLKTLEDEYGGKTTLIVSHRASTLTGCNRILRMTGGMVYEQKTRGFVAIFVNIQQSARMQASVFCRIFRT
ncbi:MAG: hypothetical protein LBN43_09300, partial [Oscillospiraceae bacterium]|nr:hypothetical protein [Oscillospiraceae bacterium]